MRKKANSENNQNSGDNLGKYLPHIGVIIVILGILIAFTLYFYGFRLPGITVA